MGAEDAWFRRNGRGRGPLRPPTIERSRRPANSSARTWIHDAASVVIVDYSQEPVRILAGRRSNAHIFMPGKLVFPGGRVDRSDLMLAQRFELPEAIRRPLLARTRPGFGERRAIALALAAIRETFEETGIMLGEEAPFESNAPFWTDFASARVRPDPSPLVPFARAITPPGFVRRYDTRFFLIPAAAIVRSLPFEKRPTDEFDHVDWMTVPQMLKNDLANITRKILVELQSRLSREGPQCAKTPLAFYHTRHGTERRDLI